MKEEKVVLKSKKDNTDLENKLSEYCIKLQQERDELKKENRILKYNLKEADNTSIREHKAFVRYYDKYEKQEAIIKEAREWFDNLLDNLCDNNDEREYFQKGLDILNKANDLNE